MKRTKQAYFRPHANQNETKDLSGVTFVFGEDDNYHDRDRHYKTLQKQYLDEQCQEKKFIKDQQKKTNQQYDQQILQINRHRGQLELCKNDHLQNAEKSVDQYNLQCAEERKLREKLQRERELEEERRELELLNQRNVKRVIPKKTVY